MNIYLLSQHNLGLGHLNRTSILAGGLGTIPGAIVRQISCGPAAEIIFREPNVEFVELPALVVKDFRSTELVPIESGRTKQDVEEERVQIMEALLLRDAPDIFITEFFPFSPHRLAGTVLPILKMIKERYPWCRIVCSSRDIPVCHGETLSPDEAPYVSSILDKYYDLLLIHSDPAVVKLSDIGKYRALKTTCPVVYTGYVSKVCGIISANPNSSGGRKILVTVGGGRDGHRIIECALKAARFLQGYRFDIVCGPFMEIEKVDDMRTRALELKNVRIHAYVRNLRETFFEYDLIICAGGYNTIVEAIASKIRCISVPRRASYEQGRRVRTFSRRNLLWSVPESRLTGRNLSRLIEKAFNSSKERDLQINTNGLDNTLSIIRDRFFRKCNSVPAPC